MTTRSFLSALALLLILAFQAWAWEEDKPVGYVQAVAGDGFAASESGLRKLEPMSPVFEGELLATGVNSKVQVIFHDGGHLVMGQESLARIREFSHEWGSRKAAENFMRLEAGPGVYQIIPGRIQSKNLHGVHLATPLGELDVNTMSVNLMIQAQNGEKPHSEALAGALSSANAEALATILDKAGAKYEIRGKLANNATGERESLRFICANGDKEKVKPAKRIEIDETGMLGSPSEDDHDEWTAVELETQVSIPAPYKLMLGEDWGGAKGGGGEGDDSGGCNC